MFTDVLLCYPPNHLYFEQKVTFVKSLFFKVMTSSMFYLSLGTLYVLEYMGKYIWENCLFTINPLVPEIFFCEFFDENLGTSSY